MSDIRLKRITVESNNLDINNGKVTILDTTASTTSLNASLVLLGGLSIDNTMTATSSTAGGALTIAGGLSVFKDTFIEGGITQDGVDSLFTVNGTSIPRFKIDSETNSEISIAPDGFNKTVTFSESIVTVNATRPSESVLSACLVLNGGLSIMTTSDSGSTSGGGLSIAGGALISKNLNVGTNIFINGQESSLVFGGNSSVDGGNNASVIKAKSPSGFISELEFYTHNNTSNALSALAIKIDSNQNALFYSTVDSVSVNNGSIVSLGGLGIAKNFNVGGIVKTFNQTDSTNSANGALISLGGLGVVKSANISGTLNVTDSIRTSSNIGVNTQVVSPNKIVLFQASGSLTETSNFTGFGVINTSDSLYQVPSTSKHIFKSSTTEVLSIDSNGALTLKGSSQPYILSGLGSDSKTLSLQGNSPLSAVSFELFTLDGDSSNNITMKLYNRGTSTSNTNSEHLSLGWHAVREQNLIRTIGTGTGISRPISLEVGITEQILLDTSGTVVNGTLGMNGLVTINNLADNALTVTGSAIIQNKLTIAEKLVLYSVDATTFNSKIIFSGTSGNTGLDVRSGYPILTLQNVGNISSTNTESFQIAASTSGTFISSVKTGTGLNRPIALGVSGSQLVLSTSGNVSINSNSENSETLYINGSCRIIQGLTLSGVFSSSNSIICQSIVESTTVSSGSIITSGGVGIAKNVNIGGNINIASTEVNSTVINGGVLVSKGVNISGELTAGNALFSDVTCGSISVESVIDSISPTTGNIISRGGVGIVKSLSVGENANVYGSLKMINSIISLNNLANVQQFSIQQDGLDLSISRYDSSGIFIERSINVTRSSGDVEIVNSAIIQKLLTVNSTQETSSTASGSITTLGGIGISKSATIGISVTILGTDNSSDINTGALNVSGGVGIQKNLYVGGNTIVSGDLIVNGTTTTINSIETQLDDNMILLNSGASGSRDAGILFNRYQFDNDSGLGDVVSDSEYLTFSLPDQSGMTTTEIKFPVLASIINDFYKGWYVLITSGFSSNQVRRIISYTGSTKIAIVAAWTSQNPSISDTINLYFKPYVGLIYNELDDIFEVAACVQDPGFSYTQVTGNVPLKAYGLTLSGTDSSDSTTGTLISNGGISIRSTVDATSIINGGTFTTRGGASIEKSLYVGGSLTVAGVEITKGVTTFTFTGANSVVIPVNVTDALVTGYGADIFMAVRITATVNKYSNYHLRIINRQSSFEIVSTYVGDDSGVSFTITNGGQVQYTSPTFSGFSNMVMKFSIIDN